MPRRTYAASQQIIFSAIQLGMAITAFYWLFRIPLPGYSIGLAAFVAAAMSIHPNMKAWQKSIWMCIIGLLLIIEFKAIRTDKMESELAANRDRAERNEQYQAQIAQQYNEFKATSDKLLQQIRQSQQEQILITKGFNDNLDAFTGGDSFCFMYSFNLSKEPSGWRLNAGLSKIGKWPLDGVTAKLTNYVNDPTIMNREPKGAVYQERDSIALPDFAPGDIAVPYKRNPDPQTLAVGDWVGRLENMHFGDRVDLAIDYEARNRPWRQVFHGVKLHGSFQRAGKTISFDYFSFETIVSRNGNVLYKHTDAGFPSSESHYPWRAQAAPLVKSSGLLPAPPMGLGASVERSASRPAAPQVSR